MSSTLLLFVAIIALAIACWLLWRTHRRARAATVARDEVLARYAGILDIDTEKTRLLTESKEIAAQIQGLIHQRHDHAAKLSEIARHLAAVEENLELSSFGLYSPHFTFDSSERYKKALTALYEQIKTMVKSDTATHCDANWVVGGSAATGKKMTKSYAKLMLRAFNGECDAAIAKVSWSNVSQMEERIRRGFDAVNKAGETHHITLTHPYLTLRLQELWLNHEFEVKKQNEREEQRAIKEQMREEEKAQRELERAQKSAQDDEDRAVRALETARAELANAHGSRVAALMARMEQMEQALAEAQAKKERALSMAQQTKAGYIYIISNVGSFGENVFKIGMTRRLEPMDRVKELGDASVPFEFDVHGLVYTSNAPEMEARLHQIFAARRVNLVNLRREYFHVSIEEIQRAASGIGLQVDLTILAEAREYRESVSIRNAAIAA